MAKHLRTQWRPHWTPGPEKAISDDINTLLARVRNEPHNVMAWSDLANSHASSRRMTAAHDTWGIALRMNPGNRGFIYQKARFEFVYGLDAQALETIRPLVQEIPAKFKSFEGMDNGYRLRLERNIALYMACIPDQAADALLLRIRSQLLPDYADYARVCNMTEGLNRIPLRCRNAAHAPPEPSALPDGVRFLGAP